MLSEAGNPVVIELFSLDEIFETLIFLPFTNAPLSFCALNNSSVLKL